jgi:PASTA domain-containing protein
MRRLAILTVLLLVAVCGVGGTAGGSVARPARTYWQAGVATVLPADAVTGTDQIVSLGSVSCASAGNCSAVGSYLTRAGSLEGLLVSETGGRWGPGIEAQLPADASTGNEDVSLNSVSCSSPGNCSAVGSYDGSAGSEALVVTETAGTWGAGVEAALPATATTTDQYASLESVSCPSDGNCTAVGGYHDSSGAGALAVTESAGTWQTGVEPNLPANASTTEPEAGLGSVSCSSAGNCSAVGIYIDASGDGPGLLLTETRGTWGTGVEAVLPANAATTEQFVDLPSVSCASAGNCSAVGKYNTDLSDDGVLLTETGGTWSPGVKAVLPSNGAPQDQVDLNAVSCPSPGSCAAVGAYVDRWGNIRSLVLSRTGGNWSTGREVALPGNAVKTSPNQLGGLYSVSCTSPGNCSAVGSYWARSGRGGHGLFVTETAGRWATGVQAVLRRNAPYAAYLTSVSCSSASHCSAAGGYQQAQGVLFSSSATPPCLVPRLEGESLTAAKQSVRAGHCSVGEIRRARSPRVRKGRVISQKPKPGLTLDHGAKVDFVVSTGENRQD